MDLTELTLTEAAGLVARRQISPVDLVKAHLDRIDRIDPRLNSFITVTADLAMEQARSAESNLTRGEDLPLLFGLPLALKDLYETKGIRTTAGSRFFYDHVPEADAFTVQKLYQAGAILLGKLNMHEIALGLTNVNPHFGACHNPWALDRITGGSSGGSAAALAAGLCLGSLGSDTGGSIRVPASLCGIVGLKPTFGRVSLRGLIPLSWNMDHSGPMGRCVRDVATLLQVIAGYDQKDPCSVNHPVDDFLSEIDKGVGDMRIALADDEHFSAAEADIMQAIREAANTFESLGAKVTPVKFPGGLEAARANVLMVLSDAAAYHHERLDSKPEDFGSDVLQRLQTGQSYSSVDYAMARHTNVLLKRKFEEFFRDYDILLTPTTPVVAPSIEGPDAVEQARLLTRFTAPFNLTGLPALSLPCGFTSTGLPIGLQIVSSPWAEALVLRAAYAYEQITDWHARKPPL